MRQEFSAKVREAAFKRAKGKCELCTAFLYVGKFRYDHVLPDWLGGEPTLENCQVICMACDGKKTPADQTRIAKTKRQHRNHIGAKPKSRAWQSRWKRKVSGEVVAR